MGLVVYRIFNKVNGRFYIGSTGNEHARKHEHFGQLRLRKHTNKNLQRDFNEFGESSFVFEVIHDGFKSRQSMLMKEYALILKTFSKNYNVHTDCPVIELQNTSNSPKYGRILKCKKKRKTKKSRVKGKRLKLDHPELDRIAGNKADRERVRAELSNRFRVSELNK